MFCVIDQHMDIPCVEDVFLRDHSENITGLGWRLLREHPDFPFVEGGHLDFANLPGGRAQLLPNTNYQKTEIAQIMP